MFFATFVATVYLINRSKDIDKILYIQRKMEKTSPIKENILYFLEKQGITKTDFCEKTGISYANMKGKGLYSEIGGTQIGKILSTYSDLSPEWLLTGKGEMLREYTNTITKIHKPKKYMEKLIELQKIPLYDIKSAASLKVLFREKHQNILSEIMLPNVPRCDGAMYVTGDSMDPLIKAGDIICYKEIHDFNNIVPGEMYLVSMDIEGDEYLAVKYITHSDKGDDWIRLESFNPRHNPKDYELRYVNALALIKISIRMNTM